MQLYLARHGETDWNLSNRIQGQTDIPLNENGRKQAVELVNTIKERGLHFDKIYTSKMMRAMETAKIVAGELGVKAQILEGIEEISFGEWEGYTWRQVREIFPEEYGIWHKNRRYQIPPGGESYEQLLKRAIQAMKCAVKESKGAVLVVTHSAVIMTMLSFLYEKPFEDMVKNFKTHNAEIVEIEEKIFEK